MSKCLVWCGLAHVIYSLCFLYQQCGIHKFIIQNLGTSVEIIKSEHG